MGEQRLGGTHDRPYGADLWRPHRGPAQSRRRIRLDGEKPDSIGLVLLERGHVQHVDGQQLAERGLQGGQHTRLVKGGRHRPGDAVEGLQAPGLVAGQLVQIRVGEQHAQAAVHLVEEGRLRGRHPAAAVALVNDAADDLSLVLDRDPDHELGRAAGARTFGRRQPPWIAWDDRRPGVGVLLGEHGAAQRAPAQVLEDA